MTNANITKVYKPDNGIVNRYGNPFKTIKIPVQKEILETIATLKHIDGTKAEIYLIQKRPYNNGRNDIILFGVTDTRLLYNILKEHKMSSYTLPAQLRMTRPEDRHFLNHPDHYHHFISFWVWACDCRTCYETSIDCNLLDDTIIIRQPPLLNQRAQRDNIIKLGIGSTSDKAILAMIYGIRGLLSIYEIPINRAERADDNRYIRAQNNPRAWYNVGYVNVALDDGEG